MPALDAAKLTVICDTREQTPLDVAPMQMVRGTLTTGDYSIAGLQDVVAVERKSLSDLTGSLGYGRDRFMREMHRLIAYPARLLVIEGTMSQIQLKQYRSQIEPNSVIGSLLGLMADGIPVLFAGDHAEAGRMVARFLFLVARRRFEQSQAILAKDPKPA